MSFDRKIAYFVTHRRKSIYAWIALGIALCVVLCVFYMHLDSEVLNLLPGNFDSVKSLKVFNNDFSQNMELTFAVYDPDHSTDMEGFTDHFATMLKKEPWVKRVVYQVPMESEEGMNEITTVALPLLFNLPPKDFDESLAMLKPDAMRAHIHEMRSRIEAGSFRYEWEYKLDPLGPIINALKPLGRMAASDQSQSFTSKDGELHMVFVSTDQSGPGTNECRAMMKKVKDFEKRVYDSWQGGKAPELLLTGRTPYVAELSRGMEVDIIVTLLGSVVMVSAIFYLGFQRVRPLVAIMHVLLLCCVFAVTAGGVIFHALNGIAIGFCSILVGLGVDFGMLLYGSYQTQRNEGKDHEAAIAGAIRQIGKGVLFGAATTAAGFLTHTMSGCEGFIQLGVLIAIGIALAALLMLTVFFVFLGSKHMPHKHDWLFDVMLKFVGAVFRSPRAFVCVSGSVLLGASIFTFLPIKPIAFHADPKSLQPQDSSAWRALRIITSKMTIDGVEPVMVLVDGRDSDEFHDRWAKLQAHWVKEFEAGNLKNVSSPAPLVVSQSLQKQNAAKLAGFDFEGTRSNIKKIMEEEGFTTESYKNSLTLLDSMEAVSKGDTRQLDWNVTVPKNSVWRFLLDKFFGTKPNIAAAYITPNNHIATVADKEALEKTLNTEGVPIHITGWSYTLANLIPWSHSKLLELSIAIVAFNVVLLIFLYRKLFPLLVLMVSLFMSIGAMVATLKILGIALNLFNVLAFPLVLGVGVDYGIYVLLAMRNNDKEHRALTTILKPVFLSGLCTICGFGSLYFAHNPSLSGLGVVCALGVAWCLLSTMLFILPVYAWKNRGSGK